MNTQGFTAGRASLNVTVNAAQALMAQIAVLPQFQGPNQGLLALFANETSQPGYMCPLTSTQNNGSAPWVDPNQDLTTLGVDPANDLLYLQIWIEASKNYEMAGEIIARVNNGESLANVLS